MQGTTQQLVDLLLFSDENNTSSEEIQQVAKKIEERWHQAQVDGLVSSNEEWDDIPTNQTIVLLFPFVLGMAKIARGDLEQRAKHIQEAITYFIYFLQKMKNIQFVSKDELKHVEWALQSLEGTIENSTSDSEKRQRKIELFKQQKLWKQKVEALSEVVNSGNPMEEEIQREWVASKLHLAVYKVVGMSQILVEELQLLQYGKESKDEMTRQENPTNVNRQPVFVKLDRMRLYEPVVKQPPPFRIPEDDPCFPLHHHHNHNQQQSKPLTKVEQDDKETDDEVEIYKQRKWDDWKDDHNKGSGNTLR